MEIWNGLHIRYSWIIANFPSWYWLGYIGEHVYFSEAPVEVTNKTVLAPVAATGHHTLGGFQTTEGYRSHLWELEVRDEVPAWSGSGELSSSCRQPPSVIASNGRKRVSTFLDPFQKGTNSICECSTLVTWLPPRPYLLITSHRNTGGEDFNIGFWRDKTFNP